MKLFAFLVVSLASFSALSQTCQVQMVDHYQRVIRVFSAYGDSSCIEGMKQCRKTIRLEPHLGGVDCIRVGSSPAPHPIPQPTPWPQPQPQPQPHPGQIPQEVLRMNELEQAINYVLEDCVVLPRVSGWANQLYVRGQFAGNFEVNRQDQELRRAIRDYQARGQCLMKHPVVLRVQFDPRLIQDFANFQYRGCHVKLNVSGWANQIYIGNQFSGNFDSRTEVRKLQAALADYVVNRTCIYDPM